MLPQAQIFWLITLIYIQYSFADISINSYVNNAFPGRCVLELDDELVLLRSGEKIKLPNLPCTEIICVDDGWGMLRTCDRLVPPDDCRFGEANLSLSFPDCCKRRVICD